MKNRSSFYFTFLMLIAFVCSHYSAAAIDYKVPPKPEYGISDNAKVFDRESLHVLDSFFIQNSQKNDIESYVLSVADTSWKDIDTISKMVCASWGICGADRSMLLLMSSHWAPRFKIILGQNMAEQFNDTMLSYLATAKLPAVTRQKSPMNAAIFFFQCIRENMFADNIGSNAYYTDSEQGERIKLQSEYYQYRSKYSTVTHKATIGDGYILCFLLFSVTLFFAYLIIWYRDYRANSI